MGGCVVGEGAGQVPEGVGLRLQGLGLLLGELEDGGQGDEPAGWLLQAGDGEQGLGELGGVAFLMAVHVLVPLHAFGVPVGVVRDRRGGVAGGVGGQQVGAEEAGVDDGGGDPERLDLRLQGLHPALQPELRGAVGGVELEPGQARPRRDRHDVPGPLPTHHRQHRAGDVHRPDQPGGELVGDLCRGQLLEVAAVEVRGVVDQHIDASEPLDRRLNGGLGLGRDGDVQPHDQQVVGVARLADGRPNRVGGAAGGDDLVSGGERGLGEVDAHAAAGAGDEPHLRVSHCSPRVSRPVRPLRRAVELLGGVQHRSSVLSGESRRGVVETAADEAPVLIGVLATILLRR